jgi:hypothetical protein
MANVFATKTGNWSDPTVWNTGALPTAADDVWANNFVVNVDINPTVLTVRTISTTGIVAGGRFELQDGVTLTCTASIGILQGTTSAVVFSLASPASATVIAGLAAGRAGASTGANQVLLSGTGTLNTAGTIANTASSVSPSAAITVSGAGATLNHIGNVNGSSSGDQNASAGIIITGVLSTVNVTGDLINRTDGSGGHSPPVRHSQNCSINVTGNVYWAPFSNVAAPRSAIVTTSGSATVVIVGSVTGADTSTSTAVLGPITGTITVIGIVSGGVVGLGINQSSLFVTGPLIQSVTAVHPISSGNWRWHSALTPTYYAVRNSANTGYRNLFSSDNPDSGSGQAATTNVRLGVVYGPTNEFTGTCAIPAANQVMSGVPVDNTVGTAVISPEGLAEALAAASAITLDLPVSSLNTPGSIGERFKNTSTVESVGTQIAAFK